MKVPGKFRTTIATAALLAATVPLSTSADAAWRGGWHGGWHGGGWGWGGLGLGLAAGALIGGALAAPYYGRLLRLQPRLLRWLRLRRLLRARLLRALSGLLRGRTVLAPPPLAPLASLVIGASAKA
jgi:hypothetical protein